MGATTSEVQASTSIARSHTTSVSASLLALLSLVRDEGNVSGLYSQSKAALGDERHVQAKGLQQDAVRHEATAVCGWGNKKSSPSLCGASCGAVAPS
jgi:hypothetical protein